MSSVEPTHPGSREATEVEYPACFMHWLASQVLVNPTNLIAAESIMLEAALTSEEVQIMDKFKTMQSQYQDEAQILEVQQTQVTQLRNAVDRIDPSKFSIFILNIFCFLLQILLYRESV